jgi:hypothetical protein
MKHLIIIQFYLFLASIWFISGCKKDPPAPPIEPQVAKTQEIKTVRYARKWDHKKLFKNYNNCKSNQYCRALYRLNSYFGAGEKEQNYRELIEILPTSTPRIQSYILFKLFPYRNKQELLPILKNIIKTSVDIGVNKLATTLFILNGSQDAVDFVATRWAQFPKALKLAVVWAIREMAASIPQEFIEQMKKDELPAIRSLYLELSIKTSTSIDSIVSCVKKNDSQSGFCALSLVRFKTKIIPKHILSIISYFQETSKTLKKRLKISTKLLDALEKLQLQGRVNKDEAYKVSCEILKNRNFSDRFRGAAAKYIGRIGGTKARLFLDRYRKDRRRRVAYAARRAIYLMETKG